MKKYLKVNDGLFWLLLATIIAVLLIIGIYWGHIEIIFSGLTAVGTIGVTILSVSMVFRAENKEKNEKLRQNAYQAYERIVDIDNQIKEILSIHTKYKKGWKSVQFFSLLNLFYNVDDSQYNELEKEHENRTKKLNDNVRLVSTFISAYLPINRAFLNAEESVRMFYKNIKEIHEKTYVIRRPGKDISDNYIESFLYEAREYLNEALIELQNIMQDEESKQLALQKQSVQSKDEK